MRHQSATRWVIYVLHDRDGRPDYVGATRNLPRRIREHKKERGYRPAATVLEEGSGRWVEAEVRWIEHYRASGAILLNQVVGGNGCYTHSRATRARLSTIGRGLKKPAGFGASLSALTKGKPHNWTALGRAAARATEFKPGNQPPEKTEKARLAGVKRWWANVSPEERSRMARERNIQRWAAK